MARGGLANWTDADSETARESEERWEREEGGRRRRDVYWTVKIRVAWSAALDSNKWNEDTH